MSLSVIHETEKQNMPDVVDIYVVLDEAMQSIILTTVIVEKERRIEILEKSATRRRHGPPLKIL